MEKFNSPNWISNLKSRDLLENEHGTKIPDWLELLIESGYYTDKIVLEHCTKLKRLLIASLNAAKTKA